MFRLEQVGWDKHHPLNRKGDHGTKCKHRYTGQRDAIVTTGKGDKTTDE